MENSFYCGDAAGRKNDFSNDDLLYSINLSLKFYTPEMLFKNEKRNFKLVKGVKYDTDLDIKEEESKNTESNQKQIEAFKNIKPSCQELILLIGSPGSGKSVFFRNYLSDNYMRINNDTIKNPNKAAKYCEKLL